jgi:dTDP-4-amino-4,6-dideoxygalactose transaminase
MSTMIPFNKPALIGKELDYIADSVRSGHISGDGKYTRMCHAFFEETLGVTKALLTTNCTHALDMSAILLDIQPGDEVIIPSFTFVSTVNAFVLRGAQPVFADIRPDTLNMDESRLEALITPKTRAVVPVHYAGVACEMDAIMALAAKYNLAVIEDNAHGLLGRYKGQMLGTFGALATQSFHETKNFTCGEGGALLINDPALIERAEIIREKGTNRSRFFRGMVDKYTWVDIGSSYLPSDALAAYLYAQLEAHEQIQTRRGQIWERYSKELDGWSQAHHVRLPIIPPECEQPYHMFYLLLPSLEIRQQLIAHLKSHGILAVFHYLPLHLSDMGRKFGGKDDDCPVTEDLSDRLLRLPFYYDLTEDEQMRVVHALYRFEGW